MLKHLAIFALALSICGIFASPSKADTVYTYTGNTFDTFFGSNACPTLCNVSGSFTLDQALAPNLALGSQITPISFELASGDFALNSGDLNLSVATDGLGNITEWVFLVLGPTNGEFARILTENVPGSITADDIRYGTSSGLFPGPRAAEVDNNQGIWTSSISVAEPSSLLLLALGMLGIVSCMKVAKAR